MKLIDDMLEADPHYQELLRIQKQKVNSAAEEAIWFMRELEKYEEAAENGNADAMYQCFLVCAAHEGFVNKGEIYTNEDAIKWIEEAVEHGQTQAILTYVAILLTGKYNNFNVNTSKNARYASTCCKKLSQEALQDERIRHVVEEVDALAEKERKEIEEEEQFNKGVRRRTIQAIVFLIIMVAGYAIYYKYFQ